MATKVKKEEKKFTFTTEVVDDISKRINEGYVIKRYENPWFKNEIGIKRSGLTFLATSDEIDEYIKCKLDIHYFAEKYCKIKREDGSIGFVNLRGYQKEILDLFDGRFTILCASRQVGKCNEFNTLIELEHLGKVRIGIYYYTLVSEKRNLTIFEKLKITLYNILFQLEERHKN